MAFLSLTAGPHAVLQMNERLSGRALVSTEADSGVNGRDLEGFRFGDVEVSITAVAVSRSSIDLPGISQPPVPGEVVVSPAAEQMIDTDPDFAKLVAGWTVAGVIQREGLASPTEVRLVYGSADPSLPKVRVGAGAGGAAGDDHRSLDMVVSFVVSGLLLINAAAAAWLIVNAGAARRIRTHRLLRLLGVSTRRRRFLVVAELGTPAAVGSFLLATAFWLLLRRDAQLPGTSVAAAQGDLWPGLAVVACSCTAAALVFPLIALPHAIQRSATVRPTFSPPNVRRYGLHVIVLAATLQVVVALAIRDPATKTVAAVVGALFAALAICWGGPSVIRLLGRRVASRKTSPGRVLVGRQLECQPAGALRIGIGIACAVIGLGLALPLSSVLAGGSPLGESRTKDGFVGVIQNVDPDDAAAIVGGLRQVEGVTLALDVYSAQAGNRAYDAVIAECADIAVLVGDDALRCPRGSFWVQSSEAVSRPPSTTKVPELTLGQVRVPTPEHNKILHLELAPSIGALLVVPSVDRDLDTGPVAGALVRLDSPDSAAAAGAAVIGVNPRIRLDLGYLGWTQSSWRPQLQVLAAAIGVTILSALLTLGLGVAAESRDRRERDRTLRLIGVSQGTRARLALIGAVVPINLALLLGIAASLFAGTALAIGDDRAVVAPLTWLVLWALPSIGASTAVLIAVLADFAAPKARRGLDARQ